MKYLRIILKTILKLIFVTIIAGLLIMIGRSLYKLWKNRRGD